MLATIALWSSVLVSIVGLAFMGKCKALYAQSAELPAFKGVAFSPEVGGLFGHFTFILGALAWIIGMINLGLALGLSPVLAVTPGFTSLVTILLYMFFKKQGITGVPGITGPPLPARVINGLIALLLNLNVVLTLITGGMSGGDFFKLVFVYALATGVPHVLAAKARGAGWMAPAITG